MSALRALAPAKVNLGLFVGPRRDGDGRHELVTVMQSISLADELTLGSAPAGAGADELICVGVPGPPEQNLAARALAAFRRETGWQAPPRRLEIVKRIPVAGGLGGGSADAAATLRLAQAASGLGDEQLLLALAGELGADVPAQVAPGRWLASGAGEVLRAMAPPRGAFGVLVLPLGSGLSTAEVYSEADRLGPGRDLAELAGIADELAAELQDGAPLPAAGELLHNDLQPAALSLCPELGQALAQAGETGAVAMLVSGSGPTVLGLFADAEGAPGGGLAGARRAAGELRGRVPAPIAAGPVGEDYGAPTLVPRKD
jgi:4-diphosphocytidyl-2-C-methyl-D-erythritol kinase